MFSIGATNKRRRHSRRRRHRYRGGSKPVNTRELQYEQFSKVLEEKKEDEAVFQLPPDDEGW